MRLYSIRRSATSWTPYDVKMRLCVTRTIDFTRRCSTIVNKPDRRPQLLCTHNRQIILSLRRLSWEIFLVLYRHLQMVFLPQTPCKGSNILMSGAEGRKFEPHLLQKLLVLRHSMRTTDQGSTARLISKCSTTTINRPCHDSWTSVLIACIKSVLTAFPNRPA